MAFILLILAALSLIGAFAVYARATARHRAAAQVGAGLMVLTSLALVAVAAVRIIPPGHVGVATLFGAVQTDVYEEGLHIVNPFYSIQEFSVRRTMFDFRGSENRGNGRVGSAGAEIVSVSSDSTPLRVDIGFPLRLNGPLAWKVFQRIGPQRVVATQLVVPAARSAVRDAVAGFSWRDAATVSRDKLAARIEERFRQLVERDLIAAGFPEEEARQTLTIQPVQLRKVLPPDKVLNAVAEKIAAEEDLERQRTLTQIAEEEARRRQNEGRGVNNLFSELPQGFTPGEIRQVLSAIADKVRAEALMKAVETGQVQVVVMNGANQPSLAVPPAPAPRQSSAAR